MKWFPLFLLLFSGWLSAQEPGVFPVAADQPLVRPEYPTYPGYVRLMEDLATRYPDRCQLEDWGTLPSGRRILTLRLTENVATTAGRPQVFCTAAMHGDETAGYWLLLRLAEHLLTDNPGNLLANVEVYLNPLANPDGAYRRNPATLRGASRSNANGVDLNRNFPDPDDGPHPDGKAYQPETVIFMEAARTHSFDLALNLHGGAEVFNYPWDTFRERHADNDWWRRISRDFASRVQSASGRASYFNDRRNGVTNGHDWYPVAGSRQDYMNYYHHCREATLEVSNRKVVPADDLPELWRALGPALVGYLSEARYGLHGFVFDRRSGQPVAATVSIPGHDHGNSEVLVDPDHGNFHRYLARGTYQVLFSAPGYVPQWRTVTVERNRRTDVLIELEQLEVGKR